MKENEINIEDRISLARRTMYTLMNTGLHGSNGINSSAAIKMYEAYHPKAAVWCGNLATKCHPDCTAKQISYCQLMKTSVTSN